MNVPTSQPAVWDAELGDEQQLSVAWFMKVYKKSFYNLLPIYFWTRYGTSIRIRYTDVAFDVRYVARC